MIAELKTKKLDELIHEIMKEIGKSFDLKKALNIRGYQKNEDNWLEKRSEKRKKETKAIKNISS